MIDLSFEELCKMKNPLFLFYKKHFGDKNKYLFQAANLTDRKEDRPIVIYDKDLLSKQKIYAKFVVSIDIFYKWYTDCLINYYPNDKECLKIYKQFNSKDIDSTQLASSLIFNCHSNFIAFKKIIVSLSGSFRPLRPTAKPSPPMSIIDFIINAYYCYDIEISNNGNGNGFNMYLAFLKCLDNQNNLPIETKSTIEEMVNNCFFENIKDLSFKLKLNQFDIEIENV